MSTTATDGTSTVVYTTNYISIVTDNSTDAYFTTDNYTDATFKTTLPTVSPAVPPIMPLLDSVEELIVFTSVIVGVLGFFLILAVIGWLADQSEYQSDPIGQKIRKIYQRKSMSSPNDYSPHAPGLQKDPELPSWMHSKPNGLNVNSPSGPDGTNTYDNESYYEVLEDSSDRLQKATQNFQTNQQSMDYKFSEEAEYGYESAGSHLSPSNSQLIRPSAVKAIERQRSQRHGGRPVSGAYETEVRSHHYQAGKFRLPSIPGLQHQRPYEHEISIDDGQNNNSGRISSSAGPPVYPRRNR